jgi:ribosomal-protein-alanine N-acetyltransferase
VTIETATAAHAEALAAIHASAFPDGERWGPDAMALQLGLPGAFGYITAAGGMVLARVVSDEAEILTLAVDPAAQRRGLGRALLEHAIRKAAACGAATIFLEVSAANAAAQALYAGRGFRPVGRRRSYYRDGSDALVLRASISSESTGG